jgi:Bacterial conjugation TrbI-like protein
MSDIQDSQTALPENEADDASDLSLQEFAKLMGLQLAADDLVSGGVDDSNVLREPETDSATPAEHDVLNDEEFNPEKNRTKVSLQNSGIAKAAVVGGASLAVILGGTMLFQSQLPKEQVAQVVKAKEPVDDKVAANQAALNKAQQSESETKAQLALSKQKDSLAKAQQPAAGKDADKSKPTIVAVEKIQTSKIAVDNSNIVPVVSVPRVSRASNVAAAPIAAPIVQLAARETMKQAKNQSAPVLAAAPPKVNSPMVDQQLVAQKSSQKPTLKPLASPGWSAPVVKQSPTNMPLINRPLALPAKTVDMNAEIQQLASAGRYGMVAAPVEVSSTTAPDSRVTNTRNNTPATVAINSNLPPLSQYFQRYANQGSEVSSTVAPSIGLIGVRTAFANGQEIIRGGIKSDDKEPSAVKDTATSPLELPTLIRTLLVGTSAKGSAVTPVLWGGGANSTAKFLLKLDEPMLDGNNQVAFPADTQFVVIAKPASTNIGLAELEVVSIIIKGMEFAPPLGSIVIRNDQGGLLIGEDYFRRDEQIANRDFNSILTGALGNVGRILNQPVSSYASTVTGGIPSSSNVVTNRDPNILGGVLEGGFRDLSTVWSQRNQQAIQELASKPNVYQLPKGRSVRIFVNQSMTF